MCVCYCHVICFKKFSAHPLFETEYRQFNALFFLSLAFVMCTECNFAFLVEKRKNNACTSLEKWCNVTLQSRCVIAVVMVHLRSLSLEVFNFPLDMVNIRLLFRTVKFYMTFVNVASYHCAWKRFSTIIPRPCGYVNYWFCFFWLFHILTDWIL